MKRKIVILAIILLPTLMSAQGNWELPDKQQGNKTETKRKTLIQKNEAKTDPKYLEGAVPIIDGKVVFTLDKDVPGKSAQEIYDIVYNCLDKMTKGENQFKESQIALVNKQEHIIAAKYREWLEFKRTALELDRTVFNYTIIATCTDGHLNMTLSRISYAYEIDRSDSEGLSTSAEEWITDRYALSNNKKKLSRQAGKFRRKTIDRKDEIFELVSQAL